MSGYLGLVPVLHAPVVVESVMVKQYSGGA
jgi:hypothetical protein